jgi:transcriptional regulator with XRE-family HTH domain
MLHQNLKFLRELNKKTQQEMADIVGVSRSTWASYEKNKSEPLSSVLRKICKLYEFTIDDLVNEDIGSLRFKKQEKTPLVNDNIRIVVANSSQHIRQNISLIPIPAIAGYAQHFANVNFVEDLTCFSLPNLPQSTYRAFEVQGKSMLPIQEGSIIVSRYVEHINYIRNNRRYIFILKEEGVVFKRVFREVQKNNSLILTSDNTEFEPFSVHLENVLEVWEMVALIEYGDNMNEVNILTQKIHEIDQKINQLLHLKT